MNTYVRIATAVFERHVSEAQDDIDDDDEGPLPLDEEPLPLALEDLEAASVDHSGQIVGKGNGK